MPKEWVLGKASDFVINPKNDIVDGPFGSNLKASEYQFSGTPIIRLQNIKRLRFINKNIKFVSNEKADELSRHSYKQGDIVITKLGDPLGLACIIPDSFQDGVIVADLVRLRTNDLAFDKKYLTYALNSPLIINQLNKHIKGTTRPRINLGIIRDLNIPVTSIFEQKIIAEKLDTLLAQVDNTKARLEQIPQILKHFRQAVLAAATSGKLTEEWRSENINTPTFSATSDSLKHFRNAKLPVIPENWQWLRFDQVAEIASNLKSPLDYPNTTHIAPNHIESWTGKVFGYQTILEDGVTSAKHEFYKGQIIYSKIRPYLCKVAIATFDGLCSADMYPINSKIDTHFLFRWMLTTTFTDWASNAESRTVLPKINQKDLSEIPVPTPPLPEQHEIVRRVEQLFTWADSIEKQVNNALARVNNLTQSILAKAFRGELTAQWRAENPELISGENSAAALLEKIKAKRAASGGKKASRKKA
ncbi:restriction endonuclease subunit S [Citrobacter sp. S2-9]|uniref:Restriction endonuclease subunit S n=2 Tax=Citrobacter enshiensis TaxID=2971264 RepID=A0ABT8PXG9_9ENTR|nr:restriction endonuclease subunit S [Citrobacter enshiensis]